MYAKGINGKNKTRPNPRKGGSNSAKGADFKRVLRFSNISEI